MECQESPSRSTKGIKTGMNKRSHSAPRSSLRVALHLLCFCRNRSPDSSIWRINRRDSQYNRVLRVFPFPKLPAVGSLCFLMPVQIENFYHTFPRDLVEIALSDGSRFPMCRRTSGVFFDCFLNVRYSLAHVSIISTRSRTVQKLLVTPAAIGGVTAGKLR
jgi:hypothetical protein